MTLIFASMRNASRRDVKQTHKAKRNESTTLRILVMIYAQIFFRFGQLELQHSELAVQGSPFALHAQSIVGTTAR